jgi:cytochrome c oxidase subunit IV
MLLKCSYQYQSLVRYLTLLCLINLLKSYLISVVMIHMHRSKYSSARYVPILDLTFLIQLKVAHSNKNCQILALTKRVF